LSAVTHRPLPVERQRGAAAAASPPITPTARDHAVRSADHDLAVLGSELAASVSR